MPLIVLAVLTLAQHDPEPGGLWQEIRNHAGAQSGKLGTSIASLDDLDLDGVREYVVGAPFSSLNGFWSGSSYVISGRTGVELRRHDGEYGWALGQSVVSFGDIDADGLTDYGAGPLGSGAPSRIYSGQTGSILYELWPPPGSGYYGGSLCGIGDHNNDGYADFAVSDIDADVGGWINAGAIYVYSGRDGSLLQRLDGWFHNHEFGGFLTNLGDTDGDGYEDFGFRSRYHPAYSAHIYSGRTLTELYRIDNPAGGWMGSGFGRVGDVDEDGCSDFVVGAPDPNAPGRAYLCSGVDGHFLRTWIGDEVDDDFGRAPDGAGDVNGDGVPDVVIGAYDRGAIQPGTSGRAAVYSGATGNLLFNVVGSYPPNSLLGWSVAGLGDLNGDGRSEVAIGAPGETVNGVQNAGSVYVYSFDPYLTPSAIELSAAAGGSITYSLDFPADDAGRNYHLLASTDRADRPWIRAHGVELPLVETLLTYRTWNLPPALLQGAQGVLDLNGDATATLSVPPGAAAAWTSRTFRLAAVSMLGGGIPSRATAAVTLTIEP